MTHRMPRARTSLAYVSGFLEGRLFLKQKLGVPKKLLWANNDFARGFRAGFYGDELGEVKRRAPVVYGDAARRDRRRFKRQ